MEEISKQSLLSSITHPSQVSKLSELQMKQLADEIRQKIVEVVAHNGGHLASSLGAVELTIALLSIFNLDQDKLIWDVGHQTYAYKLLTGRVNIFHTLRTLGGISGFPRICESPYDHFGVGHSSTSISAALGMAMSRDIQKQQHHVITVIGDGAMTAGEAFEGLNLAGHMGRRLIVVLNDNEMSISNNVGALSLFLSRTLSSKWVRQTRRDVLKFLRSIPRIGEKLALYAIRGEWSFKSFFTPGMLFEAFRFTYIGPVDGHDLHALRLHLKMAAAVEDGPVLLHIRTHKGKGYTPAENNPTLYHGIGLFSPQTGRPVPKKKNNPTFTEVFSSALLELAEFDPHIIAITAAMPEGTGTDRFRERFPERFVDTGICEQHAVTFAAGLAIQGQKPVVSIYSTFLQRSYDQIIHDVCIQNLPVTFCIDRAGLVGEDGATHQGVFDIAYLRQIPNMHILAPRDEDMLRHCLKTALNSGVPCAVRYPRGEAFGVPLSANMRLLEKAKGELILQGQNLVIIAVGNCVHFALQAIEKIEKKLKFRPTVFDPVWLKPLPEQDLLKLAQQYKYIMIVEEGVLAGGFSSAVLELFNDSQILDKVRIKRVGIPDQFIEHGKQSEQRALLQLHSEGLAQAAIKLIEKG